MLIGVLGFKYSGKDTTADYLVKNYDFTKIAFAQPMKDACKILFNFDDEQLYGSKKEIIDCRWNVSPRTVFQHFGTEMFRRGINEIMPHIKDNFWVTLAIDTYHNIVKKEPNIKVVISDVRFPNEIDAIHKENGIVIKITRPEIISVDTHASEDIENLRGDYEIINDGTLENLYNKIDIILENIRKKRV